MTTYSYDNTKPYQRQHDAAIPFAESFTGTNDDEPVWTENWSTQIIVSGKMNWVDEDLYRDLLKDQIAIYEDCDIDCQKAGSQMSIIATLMSTALGLIWLNALFMFIGAWRYRWRVCSIYCTLFSCVFQFAIQITVGVLMMTDYNKVCAKSLYPVAGDWQWYMADDFYMTFQIWVSCFIWMFIFCCCGLCSSYRPK